MVWKYLKDKLPKYVGVTIGRMVSPLAKKKIVEFTKSKDVANLICIGSGLGLGVAQEYVLEKRIRVGTLGKVIAEVLDGIYANIFSEGLQPYFETLVSGIYVGSPPPESVATGEVEVKEVFPGEEIKVEEVKPREEVFALAPA